MNDNQWVRLMTFSSESEARVVESFLKAYGIEVELLDTYINNYVPSISAAGSGMRLMVRAPDVERAGQLLREQERGSHLRLADEGEPMPSRHSISRLIAGAIIATLILLYFCNR